MAENRTFIAIDLKSFYASAECVDRHLDPLRTNLVVADETRTEKTICLAVTPALKAFGIPGRARLFEVVEAVKKINADRMRKNGGKPFAGSSVLADELEKNPELKLEYLIAPPRMARYMEVSTRIFNIYRRRISEEDIHVYSIDEVFMDVTGYLKTYGMTARELAMTMIRDVLNETGITATAGIGTNMYLCKVAMDIVAKHIPADENGVRLAELNEEEYRRQLWEHTPLTDFWRIGRGISRHLERNGIRTMGDIALLSIYNEDLLYNWFGINAELLIDHAWGVEPCTMEAIHSYQPGSNSLSSGQVLHCPYTNEKARLVLQEMADSLALDLVAKGMETDQIVVGVGYDTGNLQSEDVLKNYHGKISADFYGRLVPEGVHGSQNLPYASSSAKMLIRAATDIFDRITEPILTIRRLNICATRVLKEGTGAQKMREPLQLDLFTDPVELQQQEQEETRDLLNEKNVQQAILKLREKYGKNAVLKGMNLEDGATMKERNGQVGGHKA